MGRAFSGLAMRKALFATCALALCLPATTHAQEAAEQPAAPRANSIDYTSWDGYLSGVDSSQYSGLDQIDKDNVHLLEKAWEVDVGTLGTGHYGFRYNPTIVVCRGP